jgi:hypothetical protein
MLSLLVLAAFVAVSSAAEPADINQVAAEINKQLLKSAASNDPSVTPLEGNGPWPYYFSNLGDHFTPCFDFISQSFVKGQDVLTPAGSFFTTYDSIVNKLGFQLSAQDQRRNDAAQLNAESKLNTLVGAYVDNIGALEKTGTERSDELFLAIGQWTDSKQLTLANMAKIVQAAPAKLPALFPNAPIKAAAVLPAFQSYLQALSDIQDLIALKSQSERIQASLKENSGANGPLDQDSAGADRYKDGTAISFKPAFTVTPANQIEATLTQDSGKFTYTFTVTKNADKTSTVEGHGGLSFSIPVVSWISGSGSAGSQAKSSSSFSDHSTTTVTMEFSGIGTADVTPKVFDTTSGLGWYATEYLRAAKNLPKDQTGPAFTTALTPEEESLLGLSKVIYGRTPKVTIEYRGVVTDELKKSWSVSGSSGFSLFGIINIGGGGGRSDTSDTFTSTANSFTYTFNPPVFDTQPMPQRTVFVFGIKAVPLFPSAVSETFFARAQTAPVPALSNVQVEMSNFRIHSDDLVITITPTSVNINASQPVLLSGSLTVSGTPVEKRAGASALLGDYKLCCQVKSTTMGCLSPYQFCNTVRAVTHDACTLIKANARQKYLNEHPGCNPTTNDPCYTI